MSTQPGFGWQY